MRELPGELEKHTCPQCGGTGQLFLPGEQYREDVKAGKIHIRQLKMMKGGLVKETCRCCKGIGKCDPRDNLKRRKAEW